MTAPAGAPLVSVVMAVFDGEDHVGGAVESILEQELADLELIVVDDGSTDATPDVLSELASRDPRLRVIEQENLGLTAALVRGCAAARGRHVARQDADDRSHPGRLGAQVALLESSPEVALVSCAADYVGPGGEPLLTMTRPADPEEATRDFVDGWIGLPAHGTAMFRRSDYEAVGGYRPAFYYAQDSDLWLRLVERGLLAFVPEVLYTCRYAEDSISSARRPVQKRFGGLGRAAAAARAEGRPEEPFLEEAAELARRIRAGEMPDPDPRDAARGLYFIGASLARRAPRRSLPYLWRAVRTDPLLLRGWLRLVSAAVVAPFRGAAARR